MKTKVTGAKFRSALERVGQLFRRVVWLGAVILIRSCPSAQNMAGLYKPRDMAFDRAGNLFFVDYEIVGGDLRGNGIESAIRFVRVCRGLAFFVKGEDVCLELRELSAAKLTIS